MYKLSLTQKNILQNHWSWNSCVELQGPHTLPPLPHSTACIILCLPKPASTNLPSIQGRARLHPQTLFYNEILPSFGLNGDKTDISSMLPTRQGNSAIDNVVNFTWQTWRSCSEKHLEGNHKIQLWCCWHQRKPAKTGLCFQSTGKREFPTPPWKMQDTRVCSVTGISQGVKVHMQTNWYIKNEKCQSRQNKPPALPSAFTPLGFAGKSNRF